MLGKEKSEWLEAFGNNAKRQWFGVVSGIGLVATGVVVEVTNYRSDFYGITPIAGG